MCDLLMHTRHWRTLIVVKSSNIPTIIFKSLNAKTFRMTMTLLQKALRKSPRADKQKQVLNLNNLNF